MSRWNHYARILSKPFYNPSVGELEVEAREVARERVIEVQCAKAEELGWPGFHSDDCLAQIEESDACVCRGGLLDTPDCLDLDPLLDREVDLFGRSVW